MELLKAIRKNDIAKVEKILKRGYYKNINEPITDSQEQIPIKTIPLCLATARGQLPLVKLLLHYGADVQACNADWASPIHLATYRGYMDILTYFLTQTKQPEVIINSQDQLGDTPLHIAAKFTKVEIVNLLLHHNCNLSITNNLKKTALDTARETYNEESDVVCAAIVSKMRENAMATQKVLPPLPDGARKVESYEYVALPAAPSKGVVPLPHSAPAKKGTNNYTPSPVSDDGYDVKLISAEDAEKSELTKTLKTKQNEIVQLEDDITMCEAEKNKIKADISKLTEKMNQQSLLISKKEAAKASLEKDILFIEKKLRPPSKLNMVATTSNVEEKSYECPVCLEVPLPPKYVYQCSNGHIYCDDCRKMPNMHICPQCRVPLDKQNPIRNIAFTEIIGSLFPSNSSF